MSSRLLAVVVAAVALFASATSAHAAVIPGEYIVVLKDGVNEHAAASDHAKKGAVVTHNYTHALNGYAAKLSDTTLGLIRTDPRVRFVAADQEFSTTAVRRCLNRGTRINDNPTPQCLPWSLDRIDAELSSAKSGDGRGAANINVAVLDTGIDLEHSDLNVVGGTNCSSGSDFDDKDGHGTHVAGTIAASDNGFGVVGVAPGARLWAVRVLNDQGAGANSKVICGIDFVTATRTDADPGNDIKVANMSLGGKGTDDGNCGLSNKDPLHLAVCRSVGAGVTYVVAAGNEADDVATHVPGAYDEVLSAAALSDFDGQPGGAATAPPATVPGTPCTQLDPGQADDAPAVFSNFATQAADKAHTVAAPGVCVISTFPVGAFPDCPSSGCYAIISGTSMATPHVAGTVTLCIASGRCAGLTPAQIVQKIVADATAYNTANPSYGYIGDPLHSPDPNRYYGYLIRAGLY